MLSSNNGGTCCCYCCCCWREIMVPLPCYCDVGLKNAVALSCPVATVDTRIRSSTASMLLPLLEFLFHAATVSLYTELHVTWLVLCTLIMNKLLLLQLPQSTQVPPADRLRLAVQCITLQLLLVLLNCKHCCAGRSTNGRGAMADGQLTSILVPCENPIQKLYLEADGKCGRLLRPFCVL